MMNRRNLFACLPFLGVAPTIAKSVVTAPVPSPTAGMYADRRPWWGEERAIIWAALTKVGRLLPGCTPSAAEYEAAKFHLDSMWIEGFDPPSPSMTSVELAKRIDHRRHDRYPEWKGDDPVWMPCAEAVIVSGPEAVHEDEAVDRFYEGQQWDEMVRIKRLGARRPCLVFNRLPMLVSLAIAQRDPALPPLTTVQHRALRRAVTRRNRDAQLLFNMEMSNLAERAGRWKP